MMSNPRINKILNVFEQKKIDALLVTKDVNIQYLTYTPSSESWLLICPKKVFYITDFRYVLEAEKSLKGISVKRYENSIHETLFQIAKSMHVRRIGFDERHMTLATFKVLKKECPKEIRLVEGNNIVEDLREVKERVEIESIIKALKIHKQAHEFLKKAVKPGISEKALFFKLEEFVRSKGVTFSFAPIIASGPNSCHPHAKVTERKIRRDDSVLIDMGIDLKGYKSDLTRMFFLGKISPLVQEVYHFVKAAQLEAIGKIKSGIPVGEIDQTARNYLEKQKLEKYFGHALGHGVGLEIHESPRLSQKSTAVLKEGMIITVEPAVYIPDKFGIRIEDMVLVTKEGCEVLSDNIH